MEYRYLGNTGLRVSVLGFGVMFHDNIENMKELKQYPKEEHSLLIIKGYE